MRTFVAVLIPEELKDKIINLQNKFSLFDIKLVEKENLHFNLKFLGEVPESSINQIKEKLKIAVKIFEPFKIKIAGVGAFPSKTYIRVIWLGVKDGYQNLLALANSIEDTLADFRRENRKFEPHLTLGRIRSGKNKEDLKALVDSMKDFEIGEMEVKEIKLMQSKLSPKGPEYSEVFSVKLGV